ncbi:MAG TPA: hypothetical protein VGM86_23085, partial [Thermoanaerobaculia bacterium]
MARSLVLIAVAVTVLGTGGPDGGRVEPERKAHGASAAAPPPVIPLPLTAQGIAARHREHLAAGQPRRYGLSLQAGQYLQLAVDQLGVDLVAIVQDPAGRLLLRVDSPTSTQGAESVFLVAGTTGRYVLEIDAFAGSGDYEIRIEALRAAGRADRKRAAAAKAFSEARALESEHASEAAAAGYRKAAR